MRSILTISALVSKGLVDSSFQYHALTAKKNGVTKTEMAEILTQLAFYAGWSNAWAAFRVVKDVYADDNSVETHGGMFGMGEPNTAFAQYFTGVKHWHGAKKDSCFSHLAVECPGENCSNEWLEAVTDEQYNSLDEKD